MSISNWTNLRFVKSENIEQKYFDGALEYVKDHFFYIQTVRDIERLVNEYLKNICEITVDYELSCPVEVDSSDLCCSMDDDEGCDRKAELIFEIVQSILKNTQR